MSDTITKTFMKKAIHSQQMEQMNKVTLIFLLAVPVFLSVLEVDLRQLDIALTWFQANSKHTKPYFGRWAVRNGRAVLVSVKLAVSSLFRQLRVRPEGRCWASCRGRCWWVWAAPAWGEPSCLRGSRWRRFRSWGRCTLGEHTEDKRWVIKCYRSWPVNCRVRSQEGRQPLEFTTKREKRTVLRNLRAGRIFFRSYCTWVCCTNTNYT